MSAIDTTWDVEKYKSPFDSEEHWELRKSFLLAHKNKYPEDQLICLAQVFFNIELLGCKYPQDTMKLVAKLSSGIADSYREGKKQKLQRTFVKASDAAEAKFKGLPTVVEKADNAINPLSNISSHITNPADKSTTNEIDNVISSTVTNILQTPASKILQNFIIWKTVEQDLCKDACVILNVSIAKCKLDLKYKISNIGKTSEICMCELIIQDHVFCTVTKNNKKGIKSATAETFLLSLIDYYYTIEEKVKIFSDGQTVQKKVEQKEKECTLEERNIGSVGNKIMKLMGWSGGGLGKTGQGISEPISVQTRVLRSGLGTNLTSTQVMNELRKELQNYAKSSSRFDLVFSNEYTKEERAHLHQIARRYHLKSRSYGSNQNRYLVLSKPKKSGDSLLDELLTCGGENERYRLIPPYQNASTD